MSSGSNWKSILAEASPAPENALPQIPRILHHVFFKGVSALSPEIKENVAALRTLNPEWDYRFYDQEGAERFIKNHYGPQMLDAFLSIHPDYYAARSDLLRYLLCYADGGVYMDIKSGANRPFDEVLQPDDVFLLSQWDVLKDLDPKTTRHPAAHPELHHIKGFEYVQWFVASAPRHRFLEAVIDEVLLRIERYNPLSDGIGRMGVLRMTGPIAYTLAIEPVLDQSPHRFVNFKEDLGFAFSVYGDHKKHHTAMGKHYSEYTQPIVKTGPLIAATSNMWFGLFLPQWMRVRYKLQAIKKLRSGT